MGDGVSPDNAVQSVPGILIGQPSWEPDGRKCPHCGSEDTYFWQYQQTAPYKPQRIILGAFGDDVGFEIFKCKACNKGFVENLEPEEMGYLYNHVHE